MTIVNAAGSSMTDVTDDSQLRDVTDDQKPPGTRSYLTVGLPDPLYGSISSRTTTIIGLDVYVQVENIHAPHAFKRRLNRTTASP